MDSNEKKCTSELSPAKDLILRKTFGSGLDVYTNEVKSQIALLDEDEIKVLASIKAKLNSGLSDKLRSAASDVGVIVW